MCNTPCTPTFVARCWRLLLARTPHRRPVTDRPREKDCADLGRDNGDGGGHMCVEVYM